MYILLVAPQLFNLSCRCDRLAAVSSLFLSVSHCGFARCICIHLHVNVEGRTSGARIYVPAKYEAAVGVSRICVAPLL